MHGILNSYKERKIRMAFEVWLSFSELLLATRECGLINTNECGGEETRLDLRCEVKKHDFPGQAQLP